ncbi:restriction endonuclease [Candidatus Electronema sp. TJ]|uniref:restriction endonuclease n=1 Tax=Candidatus Electronema sp. TJ TaxID=3401573 RepID=UPI003AA96DAF
MRDRRFWAIRTDKYNQEIIFEELKNGKLRQGWGYDESQNLFLIQSEIDKGGKWWNRLSDIQKESLRNLRMLSDAEDSIQIGDIILTPNLPKQNSFCLAEVSERYVFNMLTLNKKTDINNLHHDYGHVLPVKLITLDGINKFNENVHADLRSTLRTPMRMWNLDTYKEHIEKLISCYDKGKDLGTASSGEAKLSIAWENALLKATKSLQDELASQLDQHFQASEWEEPIKTVLSQLYPGVNVRWTGGPYEYGADIVLQIENFFGEIPWLIVVQVKNYTGEINETVLGQIKEAHECYSKEGKIILGVIMTTAESKTIAFDNAKYDLEKELGIPIELILRQKLIEIMTEGLSKKML